MYSAASFLIRRRYVLQFSEALRCFSTRTLTLTLAGGYDSSNSEERIPKQVVFSQDQEPQQQQPRRLFSLSGSKDHNFLEFQREIDPLNTASAGKPLCVGSSEGILFSVPNKDPTVISAIDPSSEGILFTIPKSMCMGSLEGILFTSPEETPEEIPTEMSAVDPLTGTHLPLPSISALWTDSYSIYLKPILSPSRDMVILSDYYARLGDEGDRSWTELRSDFVIHDTIFHKGLLYALFHEGLVGIYDLNNPSWPTLTGSQPLAYADHPLDPDCLVESPDGKDLFLVSRRTFRIEVFKLSQRGNWTRVRSIGDMAIFAGINQSVSLPASHFPDMLKPNSIYFTGCHRSDGAIKPYAGVFSLEDKSIQLFKLTNGQELCHWKVGKLAGDGRGGLFR